MKHSIESIIKELHAEVRSLVCQWDMYDMIRNTEKYIECADLIAKKVREIKNLKQDRERIKKKSLIKNIRKII